MAKGHINDAGLKLLVLQRSQIVNKLVNIKMENPDKNENTEIQDSKNPEDWPDGLPPCLIHVDKEGQLFHYNAPMTHKGINRLLTDHVELDDKGRYVIDFNNQRCFVDVADTFFVIARFTYVKGTDNDPEKYMIILNDETAEELDPSTLSISEENIMYTKVKVGRFPARFLRPAYYQLAEEIQEKDDKFVLIYRGKEYPVG